MSHAIGFDCTNLLVVRARLRGGLQLPVSPRGLVSRVPLQVGSAQMSPVGEVGGFAVLSIQW